MSEFYTKLPDVKDGDVAYARDVNDINNSTDTAFELVEGKFIALEEDVAEQVERARQWAENPYSSEVEPGSFSALHWSTVSDLFSQASETSADASAVSAGESLASANAAKVSEDAAKVSEDAAKVSEDAAKVSEDAAKVSEDAAKVSEVNAKASEDAALISEQNAAQSEANIGDAEQNCADSAAAALISEDNAESSAVAATTSEDNAKVSEVASEASAVDAANSAIIAQSAASQNLAAINAAVSDADDIVDVFIYDTSKDIDGGAWRNKMEHTSWMRESLNTTTRGNIAKFPTVALIVATVDTVTIYDATQVDVPMWMVFEVRYISLTADTFMLIDQLSAVTALGGVLSVAQAAQGVSIISFLEDGSKVYRDDYVWLYTTNIANRNELGSGYSQTSEIPIVNRSTNDAAMTVLDGNDYPTIAVATNGGVSVIDGLAGVGTVVDITASAYNSVSFTEDNRLLCVRNNTAHAYLGEIPIVDILETVYRDLADTTFFRYAPTQDPSADLGLVGGTVGNEFYARATCSSRIALGSPSGLTLFKENPMSPVEGMVNYITSDYQSGWQVGDSLMATLAETEEGTIGTDTTTEHIVNGTFDTDTSGWTATSDGTIASVAGELSVTNVSGSSSVYAEQYFTTVAGQVYNLSLDVIKNPNGANVRIGTTGSSASIFNQNITADGTYEISFKAVDTATRLSLGVNTSDIGFVCNFDNITVKAVQNLVENGEFSSDRSWTKGIGWSIGSGVASCDGTQTGSSTLVQSNGIVPLGVKKKMTFDVSNYSAGQVTVYLGSGTGTITVTANGSYEISNVNISDDLTFVANADFIGSISNVIVTALDVPDRSAKNNPLQVIGELTKTPVATDSELVAYEGFSADNYIEQLYSSDLDFGTGDFHVMLWVENVGASKVMFERYDETFAGPRIYGYTDSSGHFLFRLGSASDTVTGTSALGSGRRFLTVIREAGTVRMYVDGIFEASLLNSENLDKATAFLRLGTGIQFPTAQIDGNLCLFRMGASAPSADQIKYIYDTEKRLFEEGAKCTLTGPSSAVTALDYDESTDKLFVGTDSGSSDLFSEFTGLVNTGRDFTYKWLEDSGDIVYPPLAPPIPPAIAISAVGGKVLVADSNLSYTWIPALNLREDLESLETPGFQMTYFVTPGVGQTQVEVPEGFVAEMVYDNGLLAVWTKSTDGFRNYVNLVASSGDVTIMARRI